MVQRARAFINPQNGTGAHGTPITDTPWVDPLTDTSEVTRSQRPPEDTPTLTAAVMGKEPTPMNSRSVQMAPPTLEETGVYVTGTEKNQFREFTIIIHSHNHYYNLSSPVSQSPPHIHHYTIIIQGKPTSTIPGAQWSTLSIQSASAFVSFLFTSKTQITLRFSSPFS